MARVAAGEGTDEAIEVMGEGDESVGSKAGFNAALGTGLSVIFGMP